MSVPGSLVSDYSIWYIQQMRKIAILITLALVAAACSAPTSTSSVPDDAPASSEAADPTATTVKPVPENSAQTTIPPAAEAPDTPDLDCHEIWPEDVVTSVIGTGFSLFSDATSVEACGWLSGSTSVVVAFRSGTLEDLESSQTGAAFTGELIEVEMCEAAFQVVLQDTITITEALSNGLIYQVTATGLEGASEKSLTLLKEAC